MMPGKMTTGSYPISVFLQDPRARPVERASAFGQRARRPTRSMDRWPVQVFIARGRASGTAMPIGKPYIPTIGKIRGIRSIRR